MVIDDYDQLDEKQDVAIITPTESPEEPDPEPMADDCKLASHTNRSSYPNTFQDEAMKARYLQPLPDLEIESEAVNTWQIENYRGLAKREHGPIFHCGGHPWSVYPEI